MVRCRPLTELRESRVAARIRLEGRLTRAERDRNPYAYRSFDVPPGTGAIRVSLDHDPQGSAAEPAQGAVLDLGLIGPGSLAFGTPAFRGWSGSERRTVIVGASRATPGYRPGPIEAGRWHAILGLYAIPVEGCAYRLDVDLLAAEPGEPGEPGQPHPSGLAKAAARIAAAQPRPAVRRWIACDLHAHTVHSDGADEITTVADVALEAGLEVLFVTDHNTDSHHPQLAAAGAAAGIELLPGEEVTTYGGHFNALGTRSWIDFRHTAAEQVRAAIDEIHAQAGLASINHPASGGSPWTHGTDLPFDLVEVWNGPWRSENERALRWWTELLRSGRRPTAVGGSDAHSRTAQGQPIGSPVTWVLAAEPGRDAIIDGLRAGRAIVARDASVRLPQLSVADSAGRRTEIGGSVVAGGSLEIHWQADGQAGRQLRLWSRTGPIDTVELASDRARGDLRMDSLDRTVAGYVRLEIRAEDELLALTNPIFLEVA